MNENIITSTAELASQFQTRDELVSQKQELLAAQADLDAEEKALLATLERIEKQRLLLDAIREVINGAIRNLASTAFNGDIAVSAEAPENEPLYRSRLETFAKRTSTERTLEASLSRDEVYLRVDDADLRFARSTLNQTMKARDAFLQMGTLDRFLYSLKGKPNQAALELAITDATNAVETTEKQANERARQANQRVQATKLALESVRLKRANMEIGEASEEDTVMEIAMLNVSQTLNEGKWDITCDILLPSNKNGDAFDTTLRLNVPADEVAMLTSWIEQYNPPVRPEWFGTGKLDIRNAFRVNQVRNYGIRLPLAKSEDGTLQLPRSFRAQFAEYIA